MRASLTMQTMYYHGDFRGIIIIIIRTEGKALSRKEIIESVRDSLENLQLEYIDLLVTIAIIITIKITIAIITIAIKFI